ncbi:hypothetical protein [Arenicella sp. 4NH20-0111]|uniref:hypothetical protein n=1 Tax=Arenicella sp. 4NH20-0111 TaxID=3127648 RepID=UPI00333FA911
MNTMTGAGYKRRITRQKTAATLGRGKPRPCSGRYVYEDMEEVHLIRTSFSLSDAEYPTFTKEGGVLTVRFEDWQESAIEIYFGEVIAFKWQECEQYLENEKDDCCYQILNSSWLKQHWEQGIIVDSESYKHYRFNFNCNGQLEVISNGFQTKT